MSYYVFVNVAVWNYLGYETTYPYAHIKKTRYGIDPAVDTVPTTIPPHNKSYNFRKLASDLILGNPHGYVFLLSPFSPGATNRESVNGIAVQTRGAYPEELRILEDMLIRISDDSFTTMLFPSDFSRRRTVEALPDNSSTDPPEIIRRPVKRIQRPVLTDCIGRVHGVSYNSLSDEYRPMA